jgi:penicillin-binding protein 1C
VLVLASSLMLAGCVQTNQLGERPTASVIGSVEAYLQRYQPGPTPRLFQSSRIYDRRGRLLAERFDEGRRTWVGLDRISRDLIAATIATEDVTFYSNTGVDPARIAGAALQNAQEGGVISGASTITMQLARNLFLGPDQRYDQTMDRKMVEAGLAQELTALFSKDEILEMYFNLLNYGHLAYGPEAAARVYFEKPAADLSLAEATLLAGIPQRPAELDPFRDLDAAKARQRVVLDLMVRHGYLSEAEADAAFRQPVALNPNPDSLTVLAPHFVQYVEDTVDARLGKGALRRGGLVITTTLDLDMQNMAQGIVSRKVAELQPKYDLSNGALVALRPGSGEIMAMVGSADFGNTAIAGQVNVAVSPRQPGSAIKPVLYATALSDNLISPATVLWDVPVTYTVNMASHNSAPEIYTPVNYDDRFHGPVTVRTALANSYNVPAVKLLDGVTVERLLASAQAMGMKSLSRGRDWYGLSLTLGGGEVTLLELTSAFAILASGGQYVQPKAILSATDSLGRAIATEDPAPAEANQIVSPAAAFLVTDILSDNAARVPMFGVNSLLKLSKPAAAKTGTTTDWRDNWTLGYTRYLVAGVWAGNSDGHPMKKASGLTGAAPIWHDFMEGVLAAQDMSAELGAPAGTGDADQAWQFTPPPDVEQRADCPPGVTCRAGGEYFSRAWLEAAGEAGPLADSTVVTATAPVYVNRGEGSAWVAYCSIEPAAQRRLLRLPGHFGLPASRGANEDQPENGAPPEEAAAPAALEPLYALAWTLEHPAPVDLGRCDRLGDAVGRALAVAPVAGGAPQVLVDLAAAMDPNAGPVAGSDAVAVAAFVPGDHHYQLAEPISSHRDCPGNYVVGQVLNSAGGPVAGVHIVMVDQWGNRADAVSKSGASDYGRYDLPLNGFANRYTLTVVDDAENPISSPVVVDHLQGSSGDAPCHTVIWRGM